MEYLIRDFRENDIDTLIHLCNKHAAYEGVHYNGEGKRNLLLTALLSSRPKLHCWVVEAGDDVVGYVTYTFDFSTWHAQTFLHLDCLYLEEAYRGLGIGEKIIRRLHAVAKINRCVNLQWQTPTFNERAIRFYHRMGAYSLDKKRFFL